MFEIYYRITQMGRDLEKNKILLRRITNSKVKKLKYWGIITVLNRLTKGWKEKKILRLKAPALLKYGITVDTLAEWVDAVNIEPAERLACFSMLVRKFVLEEG
jgi:hypothetical protein